MSDIDPKRNLNATEARQGESRGRVRYVLLASLVLVVLGFVFAFFVA